MANIKTPSQTSHTAGDLYLIFLATCLIAIGGFFIWLMWSSFQRANSTREWDAVPCLMIESFKNQRVIPNRNREYQWRGKYEFEYNQQTWIGTKLESRGSKWSSKEEKVDALTAKYKVGKTVQCYVNPDFPEEAILKHDSKGAGYSIWFPGIFVLGGIGMIIGVLRKRKK